LYSYRATSNSILMKPTSHFLHYFITLLIFYFPMNTNGQNVIKNYVQQWKIVEEYTQKKLPKSALEEVKKIYQLAKKDNQEAQVIKAAVYMIELQADNREEHETNAISQLEQEIAESKGPAKAILTNLLATNYYSYYSAVRWQLYSRTATSNFKKEDIKTWTTEDFHEKIAELYLESIANPAQLKKTPLEPFDAIITKGTTRKLRPTLYDLLAHKSLYYFSSDERNIKKPAYAFEIDQASAFDPAADFIHRKFVTKDSSSLEYQALLLYQKLIAFHINDPQPDALIDLDLQRIQYVKQKSVHPDTDELYLMAINHVADQYQKTPAAAKAWYLKAAFLNDQGNLFNAGKDTSYLFQKVRAAEICRKVIAENPETEGGVNAYNLLNSIHQKYLQFTTESVNVPEKPFRVRVEYKNFDKLYLRLVKSTDAININLRRSDLPETWKLLQNATAVRKWEQALPDTKDYQQHSLEIKVDALPPGEYILLAGTDADFGSDKTMIGARLVYISNISYLQQRDNFFVLNRDSGQPLAGANVQIWDSGYDYTSRTYKKQKGTLLVTDKNGYFKKPVRKTPERRESELLEITNGNDRLFLQDPLQTYYIGGDEDERPVESVYLFTDRSIYRPGQTVYYKGIVKNGEHVLNDKARELEVVLYDVNSQEVAKIVRTTNDYGSFSGNFILPKGALNGQFHIGVKTDEDDFQVSFRVEEYKRPKFAASFEPVKETYKVNDTITVTGAALAYAGNVIDGAKVSYRVVRQVRLIYPWLSKRWWSPSQPLEIKHGEILTNAEGKFMISFEAIPDRKTDKKLDPVFDYMIYADVTDTNGETRSANTTVSAGFKSLLIKADIPATIPADSLKSLSIRTENMNGEIVASDVTVKMIRLTPENRLIRERLWQAPDLFVLTKNEFINHFPNDEYDRENQPENWREQGIVQEKTARTDSSKRFQLTEKVAAGFYKIEISTTEPSGEESKDIRYMEVTIPEKSGFARPQYLWAEGSQSIEPGEKTNIKIGTSADNVFLINGSKQKSRGGNTFSFSTLDNQKKTFDFSATETDRGGYQVEYFFVKHNRFYRHTETIQVPWTNKDLNIEYQTFRDKTLPGSAEQWKVKITGYKKEKVAAEMLASMYDASLDQFYVHQWARPNIWPSGPGFNYWETDENFGAGPSELRYAISKPYKHFAKQYDQLIGDGIFARNNIRTRLSGAAAVDKKSEFRRQNYNEISAAPMMIGEDRAMLEEMVTVGYGVQKVAPPAPGQNAAEPVIRKNFNETAFFFPDLKTDAEGAITFSFTTPEALTKWKFQALAHTKDLALGYSSKEIITQKDLMVQPNPPRFLREGDKILFSSKVVNLADHAVNGTVSFQLFDTGTNKPVDNLFKNSTENIGFNIPAGQSTAVQFSLEIPKGYSQTLTWRVTAKAGNMSDAEENILPVLPNRMLVTESLPLHARGTGNKDFKMEKLINSKKSATLTTQSLTVEYTSNPAWYAVQALPYLMEYPYDCAEQTWNRYYANSLAASIVSKSPKIAAVFEKWRNSDTAALQSNLEKNQELKSLVLEETPWVLAAKTESEQKKNIALLFDLLRMSNELSSAIDKLTQLQSPNGGFVWFKGGPDDRYMTQYIVTGIGHLRKSGAVKSGQEDILNKIISAAIPYLDQRIKEDYDELVKRKADLKAYSPSPVAIQYLYMRSFYPENKIPAASQKAYSFFMERTKLSWTDQTKYLQGLTAMAVYRSGDKNIPVAILKSLKETAINNEELGMYWKDTRRGWWWHEAPIERQALMIEAFQEISGDAETVDDLKTWLLKNKQTNGWESTKATAEACYALLMKGSEWLNEERLTVVKLGNTVVQPTLEQAETGTGYFKKTFDGSEVDANMGNIRIETGESKSASTLPTWGAIYWQYFEDLDKITFADTPLKLSKKLFIEKNTDRGPVLSPVNAGTVLHVGDKIKVRIELRADRDMEYVHMKDMRASSLEPENVLSQFKWQGGLGYYESTKDASVNFFFNNLRKGTYVFEYPLFITHNGDFSNGITTIQCMYAPEFTAHSEGVRIKVEK
jgi:hypothetical protein